MRYALTVLRAAAAISAAVLLVAWPLAPPASASSGSATRSGAATAGDPVDTLSGAFSWLGVDLGQGWLDPLLRFTRYYSSVNHATGELGTGWMTSFDLRLKALDDKGTMFIVWPPVGPGTLTPRPDGRYDVGPQTSLAIAKQPDGGLAATDEPGDRWIFDVGGRLVAVHDHVGNAVALTYCSCGVVSTVGDPAGRGTLTMHYSPSRQLTAVTSSLSATPVASYAYDGALLKTATDSAGDTTTYGYAPNGSLLATVTDSHGSAQLANTYDAQGRVVAQQVGNDRANGQQTTFTYAPAPGGGQITTIVQPALSSDLTFHPSRVDMYDAQGHLTRQVVHVDAKVAYTVQYGVDQNGHAVVASADATYTATPPGSQHDEAATSGCQFTLGFKTMHDLVPAVVGDCVDDASFAANGDSQQHTTRGLLVWRKSDNWTAFTDGSSTWINGPGGIATRPNTERFPWEANPDHLPVASSSAP